MRDDTHRIEEARGKDLLELAADLQIEGLKRSGGEYVGPCPHCGGDDRFSINVRKNLYNCRKCGGGDAIALVMLVRGVEFPAALEFLVGPPQEVEERELEERRERAKRERERKELEAEKFRQKHIRLAREIWAQGVEAEGTLVRDYLELRGLERALLPVLPRCLRFHPALPYMVQEGREWREVWRGPAMLAVVATPDGLGSAVHRTWIDVSKPKGKAVIEHNGERLESKTVLGSKKGGAIRLFTPKPERLEKPVTLYMGEGIETTLTAAIAGPPGALYWAGVDLGNMTGKIERGEGLKYAGRPDMTDERAFLPPRAVERLIFIQDGDSHAQLTYAQLVAGIRRAMVKRRGLKGEIVRLDGRDLNDVLLDMTPGSGEIDEGTGESSN